MQMLHSQLAVKVNTVSGSRVCEARYHESAACSHSSTFELPDLVRPLFLYTSVLGFRHLERRQSTLSCH